jgi:hypothetical protein
MTGADLLAGVPLLALLGAGVWLLRLEGRVNTHEAVCAERYRRLEERHGEALTALAAISQKLDRMVGS